MGMERMGIIIRGSSSGVSARVSRCFDQRERGRRFEAQGEAAAHTLSIVMYDCPSSS